MSNGIILKMQAYADKAVPVAPIDGTYVIRYAESGDTWKMQQWNEDLELYMEDGLSHHRPEWLQRIVDIAKVGGNIQHVESGPPHVIMWVETDSAYNIIRFRNHYDKEE